MTTELERDPGDGGVIDLQPPDTDPAETQEWLDSVDAVVDHAGRARARELMSSVLHRAQQRHVIPPGYGDTDYVNTIPATAEPAFPGDEDIERRIRSYVRWNAAMMVHRAQRPGLGVGGHISTYASTATLYEVGFNHFFRGHDADGGADQIYFQGHASPGIYARAFLEGRLSARPSGRLPSGDLARRARRRPPVVPAPSADARLLGVHHRLDGPGPDQRHLPGPVQPLPAQPRHQGHQPPTRLGVHRRRRDGRARGTGGTRRRRPGRAGQPHLRRQLQPAAPRRPGPRQRQDHPGARGLLPRRRLERHQGRLGTRVGPATRRRPRRSPGRPAQLDPRR